MSAIAKAKHVVGLTIGYFILAVGVAAFLGVVAGIYYLTHVRFCW